MRRDDVLQLFNVGRGDAGKKWQSLQGKIRRIVNTFRSDGVSRPSRRPGVTTEVAKLVAGPRVYICDRCAAEALRIMNAFDARIRCELPPTS